MSHSAELSRRMAKARISAIYASRASDTQFPRSEPPHLRRIAWESRVPWSPWTVNWFSVWDGIALAVIVASLVAIVMGWIA